jgi:hypothetical protein
MAADFEHFQKSNHYLSHQIFSYAMLSGLCSASHLHIHTFEYDDG